MLGLPAWGVKQGHGSFLTFEFGEPTLHIEERNSPKRGFSRSVYVRGQWYLWIYCCHWRIFQDGTELAWSENDDNVIARATATLSGQKLIGIGVTPDDGRSVFTFDLGGTLETWPYGDDPSTEQWIVMTDTEAFEYRADGAYSCGPSNTPPNRVRWLPLG